jgi:hypothetical protein
MAEQDSKASSAAGPETEYTPREIAALKKLYKGHVERTSRVKVSKTGGLELEPPDIAGRALLMEAIGTSDQDFFRALSSSSPLPGATGSTKKNSIFSFRWSRVSNLEIR